MTAATYDRTRATGPRRYRVAWPRGANTARLLALDAAGTKRYASRDMAVLRIRRDNRRLAGLRHRRDRRYARPRRCGRWDAMVDLHRLRHRVVLRRRQRTGDGLWRRQRGRARPAVDSVLPGAGRNGCYTAASRSPSTPCQDSAICSPKPTPAPAISCSTRSRRATACPRACPVVNVADTSVFVTWQYGMRSRSASLTYASADWNPPGLVRPDPAGDADAATRCPC